MSNPNRPKLDLPPEQQAIRDKCFHPSGTFVEFSIEDVETSIPARFEKIVRLYPDRLAVKMGERALAYDELNRYANRIARAILEKRGPGSEPIALLFEHGIDVIAALMGVLKAGKFYVALDPSFPRERLEYMLHNSEAPIVLINQHSLELGEQITKSSSTLLNIEKLELSLSTENLGARILPADLVNIRYTSGSTGVPKGVTRNHRSSSQVRELMEVSPDDRVSLVHSLSFGSSAMDLYVSLLNGAAICLFDVKLEGVQQLANWLNEEQITVCHFPPDLFRQLVKELSGKQNLSLLRLIRLSGASIGRREFDLYRNHFPSTTLLEIGMGSTEAGHICSATLNQTFSFPDEGTPIGYPVKGIEILLLGEDGREVSLGEIGEIAVSGPSLAFGYWKEPDLTGAKFLPNPRDASRCIYLTGDLGQMLPDGFLIHRGRKDLTIKIRGYRVNVSEVEAALLKHTQVKEAGVAAWDRDSGEKYLVGYVVPREEPALDVSELNKFLRSKLPDYMIPATVMFLDFLPLTNGKLDRNALPKPDNKRPDLSAPYVAPSTDVEKRLSRIWSEVLSLEPVGVHDNFFDVGGHSLTASRVISRVTDNFQVDVPVKSLFESPTLAGFAQRVEGALHQAGDSTFLPLISVPRGSSLPASFGQRALWFHDQLEPGSCAYNFVVLAYHLSGGLDVKALEQCINHIIDRHEALRTVFEAVDGQPFQTILPEMTIELPLMDLGFADSDRVRELEIVRIAGTLAGQAFDLARGPLLRTALLRLANDEHVMLLVVHHVVFDGWSSGIFVRELSQIYNSVKRGEPPLLPPLHIQYGDFAVWQRNRLRGTTLENHLSYWKKQLDGLPTLELPIARFKPVPGSPSSGREEFDLSQELSAELRKLSSRTGTTLFMTLLAAYKVALHRYTGETDVAIGTPTAGRSHPSVEGLIGYFLNMLVLRTDLSGNPTFRELLESIGKVCVDAFTHQDLPFEKIVEELRPRRDLTQNPLIQVTFALQNTPRCSLNLEGVTAQELEIRTGIARTWDLHLFMEDAAVLRGYVSYNQALFDADTIRRLIGHLQKLLEGIVANCDQRIDDLPMLTEPEKRQLLVEWNETQREYPTGKCLHQQFEMQVEVTPVAIAVVSANDRLTYRDLNVRANRLAHQLRAQGVGPNILVGLCVERSIELVIGILGILKAGGAYVPLDPSYPKERLEFMLKDSNVSVLLSQKHLSAQLSESNCAIVYLDAKDLKDSSDCAANEANLESGAKPEDLAYVIYTSGSTGKPKGVLITHANVMRLFGSTEAWFDFNSSDVWTLFHSYAFDFSVWEIFGALLSGGKLVVVPHVVSRSPEEFASLMKENGVTVLNQTPSSFRQLMPLLISFAASERSTLRYVIFGGEALELQSLQPWFDRYAEDAPKLVNMYGITETTVHSTYRSITRADTKSPIGSLIGKPIPDLRIYVLDSRQRLQPTGVPGEIYVGGAGVARGYLKRPELTAEQFIADPFSNDPRARLYRSGDRARWLSSGELEYLGRIDDQVKIRGYRVELGEIESVLGQHRAVQSSVVMAREDAPGDKRLVGYVVTQPGESFDAVEVRRYLQQKLPEYMIPSALVLLHELPLTPSGKINRQALPAPEETRPELECIYQPPGTPTEATLAAIWGEVLKLDRVGIHDNFFDLGGHSLLATQVISRIRKAFSMDLPLRHMFELPTVAELAAMITQTQSKQAGDAELAQMLREVEATTEEDAEKMLPTS